MYRILFEKHINNSLTLNEFDKLKKFVEIVDDEVLYDILSELWEAYNPSLDMLADEKKVKQMKLKLKCRF